MNDFSKNALVLGGTGAVGSALVRELSEKGIGVAFTYHQNEALAGSLGRECGARPHRLDLADAAALPRLAAALEAEGALPHIVIHSAGVVRTRSIDQATDEDWAAVLSVHARAAFQVCREFGGRLAKRGGGEILIVSALDRSQSLPLPAVFAASQGAVATLVMAAAKDLGPHNVHVNVVALGLLDQGLGKELDPKLIDEFKNFSALRRLGTPAEVAKTLAHLALHNTYSNGKILSVNGGI